MVYSLPITIFFQISTKKKYFCLTHKVGKMMALKRKRSYPAMFTEFPRTIGVIQIANQAHSCHPAWTLHYPYLQQQHSSLSQLFKAGKRSSFTLH